MFGHIPPYVLHSIDVTDYILFSLTAGDTVIDGCCLVTTEIIVTPRESMFIWALLRIIIGMVAAYKI